MFPIIPFFVNHLLFTIEYIYIFFLWNNLFCSRSFLEVFSTCRICFIRLMKKGTTSELLSVAKLSKMLFQRLHCTVPGLSCSFNKWSSCPAQQKALVLCLLPNLHSFDNHSIDFFNFEVKVKTVSSCLWTYLLYMYILGHCSKRFSRVSKIRLSMLRCPLTAVSQIRGCTVFLNFLTNDHTTFTTVILMKKNKILCTAVYLNTKIIIVIL